MKILIADDEKIMRSGMEKEVKKAIAPHEAIIFLAEDGQRAVEIFKEEKDISLVFLDVEMPRLNGLKAAKSIKEISPDVDIIMTTAYSDYAIDAYRLHIGGYLLKPVDANDIKAELDNLKITPEKIKDPTKLIIKCFGEFSIEFDGKPLHFSRTKSKEFLAYLTAKANATSNRSEICGILWEGTDLQKSKESYMSALLFDIKKTLKQAGLEDVFYHNRNEYKLVPERIECDYFEFLKGNPIAIKEYRGEFMNQYSWAEEYIWDLDNAANNDR